MPHHPLHPSTYLITNGATTAETTPSSKEFRAVLALVERAAAARVTLVQIREKRLRPRVLYQLVEQAALLTARTDTRLLVNDRADVARAAGADGVHLTSRSLDASTVRRIFGGAFLIGVSTHSLAKARSARDAGADFATYGPVFETPSKRAYGSPVGVEGLRAAAVALSGFPLLALGGITLENMRDVIHAGAAGIAAIRLFEDDARLASAVRAFEDAVAEQRRES